MTKFIPADPIMGTCRKDLRAGYRFTANGNTGYKHLKPGGYDEDLYESYEKANADEENDLKRLGELISQNMSDWWD